jgi:hypothetical protein
VHRTYLVARVLGTGLAVSGQHSADGLPAADDALRDQRLGQILACVDHIEHELTEIADIVARLRRHGREDQTIL